MSLPNEQELIERLIQRLKEAMEKLEGRQSQSIFASDQSPRRLIAECAFFVEQFSRRPSTDGVSQEDVERLFFMMDVSSIRQGKDPDIALGVELSNLVHELFYTRVFYGAQRSKRITDMLYSREEIEALRVAGGSMPTRGVYCPTEQTYIPVFADLTEADVEQLRRISQGSVIQGVKALRTRTGCGLKWAHHWVIYQNAKVYRLSRYEGPPCPYCGEPLASALAKQCFSCGMDWHDPENVINRRKK